MNVRNLAAVALALVLVVLTASAAIRLGQAMEGFPLGPVRIAQRVTASLEVLAMLGLAWLAWRRRAVMLAAALTLFLSVLGILAGQNPPPAAALGNLLAGLALAATFAWILGGSQRGAVRRPLAHLAGILLGAQCLLGAWISIFAVELWNPPLFVHGFVGVVMTCGAAWLALKIDAAVPRVFLILLALLVPAAGFASALSGQALGATLAHAAAAALFAAAAGYAHARLA